MLIAAMAQELLASITPKDCVLKWLAMQLAVANATALFQGLMNKLLYKLR